MEEASKPDEGGGVPAWVMTFADLMTLLMCFFVLLLAFSEMDAQKFKELSGSMKNAFGVQAEIEARTIPKGTSVIAREFSPGKPQPTIVNDIRQFTIDSNKNTLEFDEDDDRKEELEREAERIRQALKAEIIEGSLDLVTEDDKIIIHILEKASFRSGDDQVRSSFEPTLEKIALLLVDSNGTLEVAGHTDSIPINTAKFRSNWALSTSRAVSVAHLLLDSAPINGQRMTVTGHADTQPRRPNDTPENRAANRRVDLRIIIGEDTISPNVISVDERTMQIGRDPNEVKEETL